MNWKEKGSKWLSQLSKSAAELLGEAHVNLSSTGSYGEQCIEAKLFAEGRAFDAKLVIRTQDGEAAEYTISGTAGDGQDEHEVAIWDDVITKASSDAGRSSHSFPWVAVIGQTPGIIRDNNPILLDRAVKLDGLRISPGAKQLREARPVPGSLIDWQPWVSNPITVHGKTQGYDWWDARERASQELNRLVGLLSVAWKTCMDIREVPFPLEFGTFELPDAIPWIADPIFPTGQASPPTGRERPLPDWFNTAWMLAKKRKKISSAVSMYAEGLRLRQDHPSLGLVAFVSAIETIYLELSGQDQNDALADSFKNALKLAVGSETAAQMSAAYARRCSTLHSGRLHGSEFIPGAHLIDLSNPVNKEFEWILHMTLEASHRLLLRRLRDDISPEKYKSGALTEPTAKPPRMTTATASFTG
ncbi:hypothetical protein ACW4TU_41345 [Streptomyces sp. QTS52]